METPKSEIYENLKILEIELAKAFPILPEYLIAVNARRINEILANTYNSIPDEIKNARDFLTNKDENNLYNYLKSFEIAIMQGFTIIPNTIIAVKLRPLEVAIDKIYATLPNNLKEAREYLGIQ